MKARLDLLTQKKRQLARLKPLPKELEQSLEEWFTVELTYSSNAIEGNTLSRLETAEVIEKGIGAVIPGKPLKDILEARNHAAALALVKALAQRTKSHQSITESDMKDIHRVILDGIDDAWAGRYRQTEVFVRGSNAQFPLPRAVPHAMKEFAKRLRDQQEGHPVRIAADAHFRFVTIHPFVDGNGRTGRLLMNLILRIHGYPMAVIRNEERTAYLASFETARIKNDREPFYSIVETAVDRSLDAYLAAAQGKPIMRSLTTQPAAKKLLRIGQLAKTTGETIHTLRFWIKEGLLEVKEYTTGGYQLFEPAMVDRVKEIRRLQQEKRLTLAEIKQKLKQ